MMAAAAPQSTIRSSELRRQQLEEYLVRKGKLKSQGSNPRCYLADRTNHKIQPPAPQPKVTLKGNLKGVVAPQPKVKVTTNQLATNHVRPAARSQAHGNTATRKALSKTLSTDEQKPTVIVFPQARNTVAPIKTEDHAFPAESKETQAGAEIGANQCKQPAECQSDSSLVAGMSTHANNLHGSSGQAKQRKGTTQTLDQGKPGARCRNNTAAFKPPKQQALKIGLVRLNQTSSWRQKVGAHRATTSANTNRVIGTARENTYKAVITTKVPPRSKTNGTSTTAKVPLRANTSNSGIGKVASNAKAHRVIGPANKASSTSRAIDGDRVNPRANRNEVEDTVPKHSITISERAQQPVTGVSTNVSRQTIGGTSTRPSAQAMRTKAEASAISTGKRLVRELKPVARPNVNSARRIIGTPATNVKRRNGQAKPTGAATEPVKVHQGPSTGSKLSQAQNDRKKKLEEWLATKGKTYKRPPMLIPLRQVSTSVIKKLEDSFWEAIEEEEEQRGLADQVDCMLDNCLKLLDQGHPTEGVWAVLENIPNGEKFAKYWICRARLLELTDTIDAVIALFEQAVHAGAQPVNQLRSALVDVLMRNINSQAANTALAAPASTEVSAPEQIARVVGEMPGGSEEFVSETPHTATLGILTGNKSQHGSCIIKHRVTATPRIQRGKQNLATSQTAGRQNLKFLTPVRRSVRIEHLSTLYPIELQEHDPCVTSLGELLAMEDVAMFFYRENEALQEEL